MVTSENALRLDRLEHACLTGDYVWAADAQPVSAVFRPLREKAFPPCDVSSVSIRIGRTLSVLSCPDPKSKQLPKMAIASPSGRRRTIVEVCPLLL